MLRQNESLRKENERLKQNRASMLKNKEISDGQISALTKSIEALQKDLKDREKLVLSHTRLHLLDQMRFYTCTYNYG